MRHAFIPAVLILLTLAACGSTDQGGQCGTGAGGNPAPRIVTAQMPNAIQNGYYYAQIRATGGAGPYTWTLNGTLPPGLTLTQASGPVAVIEGVPPNYTWQWLGGAAPPPPPPNTDDPLPFDLTVTDGALAGTTRHFLIEVDPAAAGTVTTRGISDTTVGCEFSARFNAVGGVSGAYSWTIVSGTLPPGLTLAASSVAEVELAGTPTTAGAYSFDVQASDSVGVVGTANWSLTVYGTGQALSIAPLGATATINFNLWPTADFFTELQAIGGTGGYTWQVTSGALPYGLLLYLDGQQHAALAGTITQQGTFNWQMEARDQSGNTFVTAVTLNVTFLPPP